MLRQRNRQSFDWLYNQYGGMLFGLIRRMVSEDAVAEELLLETFVAAWKSLDQFDGTSGSLLTWMLRIARAKAVQYAGHNNQKGLQPEAHKTEFWKASAQQHSAGQKQYSNS
jgi:RNA polymerase sigma-70 factor (ECF subfamily)